MIKMNNNISYLKGLQSTTPSELGAQAFIQWIKTLKLPPTTFLFLWLLNKLQSAGVVGRHKNNMIYEQNEQQNISFESVAEDNTFWAGCTSILIEY